MLKIAGAIVGAFVVVVLVSMVVHYSEWREHGEWCQAHSHEMPAKRAPGDVMGPMWMPQGCP